LYRSISLPELIPLRCFYYSKGVNPRILENLVAPPYDVISKRRRNFCLELDPNNICHIILPDSYEEAGKKLKRMVNDGTLVTDKDRCLCVYGIDYIRPDNKQKISRYGFVGLLKLVEIFPAIDGIVPHEMTFKKYTEDRLRLIRQTDANFSPIFMIYNGNGSVNSLIQKYIIQEPFLYTLDQDGFTHKVWKVCDSKDIKAFQEIINNNSIIIADGHHRYITSLRRSKEGGCKYIMALFIDFNDPGLVIYTSHRIVRQMPVHSIIELKRQAEKFFEILEPSNLEMWKTYMDDNKNDHVIGCYFKRKYLILKLKENVKPEIYVEGNHSSEWKNLNLSILHSILFNRCLGIKPQAIDYIKDLEDAIQKVDKSEKDKALFMVNPTSLEEIHKITNLGEIMPQKSTYFFPKPLSGLIVHIHTNEVE
jgi:uncharacterized protein (DUF1015 family)